MEKLNQEILKLALPSIVTNITIPLLGLADVAIVGHIGDETYIGAIAIGSMIFNIIYWIFGFLRMGTSGMTSQAFGRQAFDEIVRLLLRALVVGGLVALCFVVLQLPLKTLALRLMNTPETVAPLVSTYFSIVIWGAPAMLGLYGLTGWFIGMQNTRIPMVVAIVQNILNIAISVIFVFALGMNIEGVALGTLIAQWSGFLSALVMLKRYYKNLWDYIDFHGVFIRKEMLRFFVVNRDIFLRTLFLVAVNLFFTSAGASQGATVLAVNTLLMQLFTLFSYVLDGFAYAGEALAGKHYGAQNQRALAATIRRLLMWGGAMAIFFTVAYIFGGSVFLRLLTNEVSVVEAAKEYLPWAMAIPLAGVAAFIFDGIFIGITETRGMLISSALAGCLFFFIYYMGEEEYRNHALWFAFIIYLVIRGLFQALIIRKYF